MRPSSPSLSQTICGSLLRELQKIWEEIGESDSKRDKMLLELEQDCLDIYRRKVEYTRKYKDELCQALEEAETEIARLISALGEHISFSQAMGTLKQRLSSIESVLEELRSKKEQRIKDFSAIQAQIICICAEIEGNDQFINNAEPQVDEQDLTSKRLRELKSHLEELQKEKVHRLQKLNTHISAIQELTAVLSIDFKTTVNEVHPNLIDHAYGQSKSISNETLAKLTGVVNSLKRETHKRLQKVQDLGSALVELWNLLDSSNGEQKRFEHVTSLISSSVDEVYRHGSLSTNIIEQAEIEVERLNHIKASKMKELILKRQNELEDICREVHMDVDSDGPRQNLISLIESGNIDLPGLLLSMDAQIRKAKEEALSRKDILDRVEKWKYASDEETWLDEYEKDENRYSAGRGAHKNLKRAEKARILASKIPSLVENLISRVQSWEMEKGMQFAYGKEPLLHKLKEYPRQRQQREEEKRRTREQKRQQEQLATEKEALFGSKPAVKKPLGHSSHNNSMIGTPGRKMGTPLGRQGVSGGKERRGSVRVGPVIPLNYVALPKEDSISRGN